MKAIVIFYLPPEINCKNFGAIDFMLTYKSIEEIITRVGIKKYNDRTAMSVLGASTL